MLQEVRIQAAETISILVVEYSIMELAKESREVELNFGDYVLWFPKGNKSQLGKFTKKWFGPYKV
jgi:hypothetical protein